VLIISKKVKIFPDRFLENKLYRKMARTKRTQQERQAEIDQYHDRQLLDNLEATMNRVEQMNIHAVKLFNRSIHPTMMLKLGQLAVTTAEQHRKIAVTIQNIRHPKSTVFIKNQVNQLAIKHEQLKRQLESSKNAKVDTRGEREAAVINIGAETLA
jgi:alanyl-tRNA synthetase